MTPATVIDHIVALAIGGTNDPGNLAPACAPCNDGKSKDERSFISKGFDHRDIMLDPALADWIARARLATNG